MTEGFQPKHISIPAEFQHSVADWGPLWWIIGGGLAVAFLLHWAYLRSHPHQRFGTWSGPAPRMFSKTYRSAAIKPRDRVADLAGRPPGAPQDTKGKTSARS